MSFNCLTFLQKIKCWGKRNMQNCCLTFADHSNIPFDLDSKYKILSLIINNNIEPPMALSPGIPADMPGVDIKRNVPAMTPDPGLTAANLTDVTANAALSNANFGPREASKHSPHQNYRCESLSSALAGATTHLQHPHPYQHGTY